MKLNINNLKDTFQIGYEVYEGSRVEAAEIWNMYHNRQYTDAQLSVLRSRGQPAETFNVVKMFARMLIGYYSTVVNTVVVRPKQFNDITTASVLNDAVDSTLRSNRFDVEGDKIKLSGLISGLMVSYIEVVPTGERDQFNRSINNIVAHHVPDFEIVLDPMSQRDDYSDANWMHRFKWLREETVRKVFGKKNLDKLDAYANHLNIEEADFEYQFNEQFQGRFKTFDNYLIVHTVMVDDNDKRWSVFWSGDHILQKKEITFKEVKWPYRVQRLQSSDVSEYYGIFREVKESQKAINQAILKIQLAVNTSKALVEEDAVDSMEDFIAAYNRVNGVIPVIDLKGIKIEETSREVKDLYIIIDKGLDRIQRVLSINDSFLGMAFASDSGRKVKLQQNATIMALQYQTTRIESFYRSLGEDIANLIKQYYTANQVLRVNDEVVGERWIELNRPMQIFTGQVDQQGEPIFETPFEEVLDPANGKPVEDEDGNIVLAPIPEESTEVAFTEFDIEIEASSFNDEDEKSQLMLETVMGGQIGQMLSQINPAGFFTAAGLALRTQKTKYSPEISRILEETGAMLSGNPQANAEASRIAQGNGGQQGSQQPLSKELKLPQNTNETRGA